jgi:hypothetical protein
MMYVLQETFVIWPIRISISGESSFVPPLAGVTNDDGCVIGTDCYMLLYCGCTGTRGTVKNFVECKFGPIKAHLGVTTTSETERFRSSQNATHQTDACMMHAIFCGSYSYTRWNVRPFETRFRFRPFIQCESRIYKACCVLRHQHLPDASPSQNRRPYLMTTETK